MTLRGRRGECRAGTSSVHAATRAAPPLGDAVADRTRGPRRQAPRAPYRRCPPDIVSPPGSRWQREANPQDVERGTDAVPVASPTARPSCARFSRSGPTRRGKAAQVFPPAARPSGPRRCRQRCLRPSTEQRGQGEGGVPGERESRGESKRRRRGAAERSLPRGRGYRSAVPRWTPLVPRVHRWREPRRHVRRPVRRWRPRAGRAVREHPEGSDSRVRWRARS